MKKKGYTGKEFKKLLSKNGYIYSRCKGDHFTYKKDKNTITFNFRKLTRSLAQRLIKEYSLVEAF